MKKSSGPRFGLSRLTLPQFDLVLLTPTTDNTIKDGPPGRAKI